MAWQPGDPPPTGAVIPDYGTWVSGLDGGSIHSSEDLPGLYQQEVQRLNDSSAADQSAYSAWQASQPFTPNMGDPTWDALQTKAVTGVPFTGAERNFLLQYGQGGSTDEQIFANAANQKGYLFAEANVDRSDDGFLGIKEIPSEAPFVIAAIAAAFMGEPEALPEVLGEEAAAASTTTVSAEEVFAAQAADDAAFGAGATAETVAATGTAAATTTETAATSSTGATATQTATSAGAETTATAETTAAATPMPAPTPPSAVDVSDWGLTQTGAGQFEDLSVFGTPAPAPAVTLGGIASRLAVNLAIGLGYRALFGPKSQQQPSDTFGALANGVLVNAMSTDEPIPVVYGSRRVGGPRFIVGVTGASNEFLNVIVIWSEGPIQAINAVYFDGVASTDARFTGLFTRSDHLGADSQAADSGLTAEIANSAKWNANCTLSGIAYSWFRLKRDAAFVAGLPTITADVDGRLVYDPRDGTTSFKRNPILECRDYLTNARYGKGLPASAIDDTEAQASANTCDESVTVPAAGGGTTTQARYTGDGVVDIDQKLLDNFRALLSACRGYPVYSGGVYKLKIDKAETPLTFTLNEDNIVGAWSYSMGSSQRKYNRVKARFFDAAQSWQPNFGVWPDAAAAATYTSYLAADNGRVLDGQLDLPFTSNYYTACQIAQIETKRSRLLLAAACTATIAAEQLEIGTVVPVKHSSPGWPAAGDPGNGKLFRVAELELSSSDEVRVSIQQYDAAAYTLTALSTAPAAVATSLPDPGLVRAPGAPSIVEALYQTSGSAGVKSKATVSWSAAADVFVQQGGFYQLETSPTGANVWTVYSRIQSPGSGTVSFDIEDMKPAVYDFRVKAFNSLGNDSDYSPVTTKEIIGLTAPPSDLRNFLVQNLAGVAKFTWSKPSPATDLDVIIGGRIFVRWSPKTSGADWDHGCLINPDGFSGDTSIGFGPLLQGTYMAKACDSSGNYSVNESTFVATEALLTGLTTIATVTESPSFAGSKSNTVFIDGVLKMDSASTIDSMLTLMDSWGSIDAIGGVAGSGTYSFAGKLDLGSKTPARLFSSIDSLAFDADDFIDSRTNNIDDWGAFDGADIEDAEVQLMVRTTDDDPNGGSPSWSAWQALGHVADYNFRGFDFRLDFATGSATHNRQVSALSVTAKH